MILSYPERDIFLQFCQTVNDKCLDISDIMRDIAINVGKKSTFSPFTMFEYQQKMSHSKNRKIEELQIKKIKYFHT